MKIQFFIVTTVLALLVVSCAPTTVSPTPPPIMTEEPAAPIKGMAVVQSVDIQILESQPLQVNAVIRGQLPDAGCTTIDSVEQTFAGSTFTITLTTTTDPLALCAQALTPFEEVVLLETDNLSPAPYTVNVNGVQQAFKLLPRDLTGFKQALTDALNARDYETLRLMMDTSLTIAHWRSQGDVYDGEPAIEQLKLNHIGGTSSIAADLNKDIASLPAGTDPLSVFGLDVGPNQALFVTGWGVDGKDEAILYMNYLLDGTLYWHGVLVAKGGFASSNNNSNSSADTSVHSTTVQYILALQDISILSGPSSQQASIGSIASGQIAKVTGISADGKWWRVMCPDDTAGDCWVTADPAYTQPTELP